MGILLAEKYVSVKILLSINGKIHKRLGEKRKLLAPIIQEKGR